MLIRVFMLDASHILICRGSIEMMLGFDWVGRMIVKSERFDSHSDEQRAQVRQYVYVCWKRIHIPRTNTAEKRDLVKLCTLIISQRVADHQDAIALQGMGC